MVKRSVGKLMLFKKGNKDNHKKCKTKIKIKLSDVITIKSY